MTLSGYIIASIGEVKAVIGVANASKIEEESAKKKMISIV
jgi:hypothetical protein